MRIQEGHRIVIIFNRNIKIYLEFSCLETEDKEE